VFGVPIVPGMLTSILVALAQLVAVSAAPWNSEVNLPVAESAIPYNQTTYWHAQKIDHFDLSDDSTYQQRYFVIDDFWKPPHGPVIL
jgi:hypothetical protein